jgi:hypothetical protein
MKYYKDVENSIHVIEDQASPTILPEGCTEISKQEADELIPASRYHTVKPDGTGCEITPENQILKEADEIEITRVSEVESEKETSGIKKITVVQAHNKIDQIFDEATTVAELKASTKIVLKKMIPFIL